MTQTKFIPIRIGNPVTCTVPVMIADEPADLSTMDRKSLKIWLKEPAGNITIQIRPEDVIIDKNCLIFTIQPDKQYIGDFRLFIQYKPIEPGVLATFEHDVRAIRFVKYSEQVEDAAHDINIELRTISIKLYFQTGGGDFPDHRKLTEESRHASDQHPIEAITGLTDISKKVDALEDLVGIVNTKLVNRLGR